MGGSGRARNEALRRPRPAATRGRGGPGRGGRAGRTRSRRRRAEAAAFSDDEGGLLFQGHGGDDALDLRPAELGWRGTGRAVSREHHAARGQERHEEGEGSKTRFTISVARWVHGHKCSSNSPSPGQLLYASIGWGVVDRWPPMRLCPRRSPSARTADPTGSTSQETRERLVAPLRPAILRLD